MKRLTAAAVLLLCASAFAQTVAPPEPLVSFRFVHYDPTARKYTFEPKKKTALRLRFEPAQGQSNFPAALLKIGKDIECRYGSRHIGISEREKPLPVRVAVLLLTCGGETFVVESILFTEEKME